MNFETACIYKGNTYMLYINKKIILLYNSIVKCKNIISFLC